MYADISVSVVVPAKNEAENLRHVLPRIPVFVDEVILVDGHSWDGTADIARRIHPGVRVVTQRGRGKGSALREGFAHVNCDVIVTIDADGSADPAEIPLFVGALAAGADYAKGSRFLQGGGTTDMPLYRQLGNWGLLMVVRTMFGSRFSDLCYGYNAFWKDVLPFLNLDGDGFEVETQMNLRALRAGLKIVEVPSFEAPRINGTSNLHTFRDGWRVLRTILREASALGFQKPGKPMIAARSRPAADPFVRRQRAA